MIKALFFGFFLLTPTLAFAADDSGTGQSAIMSFLPLLIIFAVFYLFIIRPQQAKAKEFNVMLDNLKIGTKVVTTGGIIGFIKDIDKEKDLFTVTISDNVSVLIYKKSIASVFDLDDKNTNTSKK